MIIKNQSYLYFEKKECTYILLQNRKKSQIPWVHLSKKLGDLMSFSLFLCFLCLFPLFLVSEWCTGPAFVWQMGSNHTVVWTAFAKPVLPVWPGLLLPTKYEFLDSVKHWNISVNLHPGRMPHEAFICHLKCVVCLAKQVTDYLDTQIRCVWWTRGEAGAQRVPGNPMSCSWLRSEWEEVHS